MTSTRGLERCAHGPAAAWNGHASIARIAVPALIAFAITLRFTYYAINPSLSNDEASLALNLIHRSYGGLFERLDFNQAAPPGFLLLQKLSIELFGTSPYALRLLPLLAGAVACFLVHRTAAGIAGPVAGIIALALFSVSDPLITYTATNKQYSLDVAVVLAVYAVSMKVRERMRTRVAVVFALVGVAAVFLSHPAVFLSASIWAVLVFESVAARRWGNMVRLVAVAAMWVSAFATAYLMTRASIEQVQQSAPVAWEDPLTAARTLGGIVRYLLGIPALAPEVRVALTGIALILASVGIGMLVRRDLGLAIALVTPAILATAAGLFGLYPHLARTFLFVIPSLLIIFASGAGVLLSPRRRGAVRGTAAILVAILLGAVAFATIQQLDPRKLRQPTRVIAYLTEEAKGGDTLYVSRTAQYTFRYYLECGCFSRPRLVAKARRFWPIRPTAGYGQFDPALESAPPALVAGKSTTFSQRESLFEFAQISGRRRVWVLLVDVDPTAARPLVTFLRSHGRLLDAYPPENEDRVAALFLYAPRRHERNAQSVNSTNLDAGAHDERKVASARQ